MLHSIVQVFLDKGPDTVTLNPAQFSHKRSASQEGFVVCLMGLARNHTLWPALLRLNV